ncbi:MAG: Asp-tRNA(Asn)/Glu-tRNA(Gln) amidotransferase subunit GatB [Patescibacteria group bacterium]
MNYEVVIGLEIHAQLKTVSKMFCGCNNNAEGKDPNSVTCPVCMGLPGTLPVPNKKALEFLYRFGRATGSTIAPEFHFERKQYFYPDLPKAYQITSQTSAPLIGGYLDFFVNGEMIRRTIEHTHIEEDAGKLTHSASGSLVDLNRAGTPLLEIVTNPVFTSPQEAKAFMQELRLILRYLDISDADMEKGHMRADGNISLRPVGQKELGRKCEVKNINSFNAMERALEYEIKRQTAILDEGGTVAQETRGWDEVKQATYSQRSKEVAHDYRYFPEPDIPPITQGKENGLDISGTLPELPAQKRERYLKEFGIERKDSDILVADPALASYFELATKRDTKNAQRINNLIVGEILSFCNEQGKTIQDISVTPERLVELIQNIDQGTISLKVGREVLAAMLTSGKKADEIISEQGLGQVSDTGELEKIISEIITANPGPVAEYKAGKEAVLAFFVGQVMKATRGQANPGVVNELLKKLL